MSPVQKNKKYGAIIMSFGSADGSEDAKNFLERIMHPAKPSESMINALRSRYEAIGGKSPLIDIALRQASLCEKELKKTGMDIQVLAGMRFSAPLIRDALKQFMDLGIAKIIAIPAAPFYSRYATEGYRKAVQDALKFLNYRCEIIFIEDFHAEEMYILALEVILMQGFQEFFNRFNEKKPHVLFTAHSLPKNQKHPCVDQIKETIDLLLNKTISFDYSLSFQSTSGKKSEWLSPETMDAIEDLAGSGVKSVLVFPIGFISDHLEILYDIDIELKNRTHALGMNFIRTESMNDKPCFINMICEIIKRNSFD
jgi:ferrochelatase